MSEKYKNKYRIASARASWWNYGWAGAYLITICTQDKMHFFGEIVNGKMRLSPLGALADVFWHEIPRHLPSVELGSFVVMPNHVHGILILTADAPPVETLHATSPSPPVAAGTLRAETLHATSLRGVATTDQKNHRMALISPKSHTVSAIVRSYKSAVTKHANRLALEFGWQARFHDHIIRNDTAYQRISDYIENNPFTWEKDQFFKSE